MHLPINRYVHMPPPLPDDKEIKYLSLRRDLVQVAKKYTLEVESKSQTKRVGCQI